MLPKLKEENLVEIPTGASLPYGSSNQATQAERQKKQGRNFDPRITKRIALAFYPYRSELVTILAGILLAAVLGLVPSLLISHLIDDAIGQGHTGLLLIYVAFMAGALILAGIFGVGQSYLSARLGQNVTYDLRNKLYQHLQCMPLSFFTETHTGEIQSRLTNDISEIQGMVTNIVATHLLDIIIIVSTIITMLVISPLMALIMLVLLPLFVWTTYKVGQSQRRMSKETRQGMASLTAQMEETLSVSKILLLKVLGQQKYAQAQFQQENKTLADLTLRQLVIGRMLFTITYTFYSLLPVIIYLIAGEQIIQHLPLLGGTMTLGTMIAFTTLQVRLFFPLGKLASLRMEIQGALALFDRIFEYLDLPIHITDKPDALRLTPEVVNGEVTFRNVTFTYKHDEYDALAGLKEMEKSNNDEAQPIVPPQSAPFADLQEEPLDSGQTGASPVQPLPLRNISFTIKPGQLVALVGPKGAGKTTITYMLLRLYDVDSGEVEIDDINVKDIAQASLSELIGVITQETYLFHASIRENLLFARPDVTEEEMMEAAQAVAIHDRIMELYSGYNTIVGGNDYEPSDREKQLMAIARVLLKDPRILILDEPTSTLDARSERLIQTALETLRKGRTTLAIAPHLSTLLAADLILVVNKGEIVEHGTHQRLLALNGLYAQLYHKQFSQPSTGSTHDIPGTLPKTTASTIHHTTSIYHDVTETLPKIAASTIHHTTSIYHDVTESLPKPTVRIVRDTSGISHNTTKTTAATMRKTTAITPDTSGTPRDTSEMLHDVTDTLPKLATVTIRDTTGTTHEIPAITYKTPGTHKTVETRTGASPVPTPPVHETVLASETPDANLPASETLAANISPLEVTVQKKTVPTSETQTVNIPPLEVTMQKKTVPTSETQTANVPPKEVTVQKKTVPPTPTPKLPIRVATQGDILSTAYLPPSIRGIFTFTTLSEQAAPTEADTKDTM